MSDFEIAMIMAVLVLAASALSAELAISVAIVEIALGVAAGNFFDVHSTPWISFIAGFASIVLTFLAGAEVDIDLMRSKFRASALIGGLSFLLPFLGVFAFAYWGVGWTYKASLIAGIALSTTSLAVVYAVLVETGLTNTTTGKLIMASTFVTDFGTAMALSIFFVKPNLWMIAFVAVSLAIIFGVPRIYNPFARRYAERVTEPVLKLVFAALFILMFFGDKANSHAVLPAFLFGLAYSRKFAQNRTEQQRFRVVAFAFLTPFFFFKGGLNVSLSAVASGFGLLVAFMALKLVTKFVGVYPLARRYVPREAWFTTLLMSTGLTFGTISSLYGLNAGIIDQKQFSVLVTVVILSAVLPTFIAQRFFNPAHLMAQLKAASHWPAFAQKRPESGPAKE
ncbi:MAG: cation:proton antiporter [Chloroflexi bacterium]|nr:cation:proton antiporter [Chloroflexota bacterium]